MSRSRKVKNVKVVNISSKIKPERKLKKRWVSPDAVEDHSDKVIVSIARIDRLKFDYQHYIDTECEKFLKALEKSNLPDSAIDALFAAFHQGLMAALRPIARESDYSAKIGIALALEEGITRQFNKLEEQDRLLNQSRTIDNDPDRDS